MESDEALMIEFQRGSPLALEELFARYRDPLFGFFRRRVENRARAEDLTQEVFLAVMRASARYEPRARVVVLSSWFLGRLMTRLIWFIACMATTARAQNGIVEYPLPSEGAQPSGITKGPDGNVWFAETKGNKIGRISPQGVIVEFPLPSANSSPYGIANGPDGNLWFTETTGNRIGKITPGGIVSEYPLPDFIAEPSDIAPGPDGNLWFTSFSGIGKVSTAGNFTLEYPGYAFAPGPGAIVAGPDGNVWFTDLVAGKVGKITVAGVTTEYPLPSPGLPGLNEGPSGIAVGPDGNLWVTAGGALWRVGTDGASAEFFAPGQNPFPEGVTSGADGNLWFVDSNANQVARMTPLGVFAELALPTASALPLELCSGADGNIWFTEAAGNRIGMATPNTVPPAAPFTVSSPALTFSGNVNGSAPAAQTLTVSAPAGTPFSAAVKVPFTLGGGNSWLTVTPLGSLSGTQTFQVNVNQAGYGSSEDYVGNLILSAGAVTEVVLITMHLDPPAVNTTIGAFPTSFNFTYAVETTPPSKQQISVGPSQAVPIVVTYSVDSPTGGTWLSLTTSMGAALPNGANAATGTYFNVLIDPSGLAPGLYTGAITFTSSTGAATVPVTLTVTPSPTTITSVPAKLSFICVGGSCLPGTQTIAVTESGPPQKFTVTPLLVSVSPAAGSTPAALTVTASPQGLDPGVYQGSVAIALTPYSLGVALAVPVTITVIAPPSRFQEFTLPNTKYAPQYIAAGPDGNLWFTFGNEIVRMTTAGDVTEFGGLSSEPIGITGGPDGNVWFTEPTGNKIGKITPGGTVTEFDLGADYSGPGQIIKGPDGNLWFTEGGQGQIAKITPAGVATWFALPNGAGQSAGLRGLSVGPDGNVWFTEFYLSKIGKVTPGGMFAEYQMVENGSYPQQTAAGPDGNVWFTEQGLGQIGRITLDGKITEFVVNGTFGGLDMTAGADGSLWVTTPASNAIASLTPAGAATGTATVYAAPDQGENPAHLVTGPDGNLWFTENNNVGRFLLSSSQPVIAGVVNAASFAGGPIAPGELVTIGGTNLGPAGGVGLALDATGKVATAGGGVSVSFNGYPAPLLYASAGQVNCVVPYEVDGATDVYAVATYAGVSNAYALKSAAAAPGIFTLNGLGTGTVAAANGAGGFNGPANPADAGGTITFYATGEGQTTPKGVTGAVTAVNATGSGPLTPEPAAAPHVTIGGVDAAILFYGEAPGEVAGVLQFNIEVPAGLTSGNQALKVTFANGSATQDGVTVSVK